MRVVPSWMGFMLSWDSRELPHLSARWGHCKKAIIYKPASTLLSDITRICWHLDLELLSLQEQWEINFCDLEETSSMVLSNSSPKELRVSRMNATTAPLFRKKIKSNGRHQPLLSGSAKQRLLYLLPSHPCTIRKEGEGRPISVMNEDWVLLPIGSQGTFPQPCHGGQSFPSPTSSPPWCLTRWNNFWALGPFLTQECWPLGHVLHSLSFFVLFPTLSPPPPPPFPKLTPGRPDPTAHWWSCFTWDISKKDQKVLSRKMPFLKFSSRHCSNIRKTKDLAERFSESGLSLLNTFCKLPPAGTTLGIHSGAPRQLKTDTDLWFLYHPKPFLPGITLGFPPQRESSSQGSPKEAPGGAGNAAVSSLQRRLITPLFQPSLRWGTRLEVWATNSSN